ncbi:hypothetical protein [Natronorubrum daqingense]|uniref:hypothetical protein n=1 Tax=Natronorubrum daqingense TaxID=588898 RepID=UPI0011159BBD|nr:hypothetical protein [Natronorubrum daqingense]
MRNQYSRGQRDYPIDDGTDSQPDGRDDPPRPAILPDDERVVLPFFDRPNTSEDPPHATPSRGDRP